jgi:hypothetical protein
MSCLLITICVCVCERESHLSLSHTHTCARVTSRALLQVWETTAYARAHTRLSVYTLPAETRRLEMHTQQYTHTHTHTHTTHTHTHTHTHTNTHCVCICPSVGVHRHTLPAETRRPAMAAKLHVAFGESDASVMPMWNSENVRRV